MPWETRKPLFSASPSASSPCCISSALHLFETCLRCLVPLWRCQASQPSRPTLAGVRSKRAGRPLSGSASLCSCLCLVSSAGPARMGMGCGCVRSVSSSSSLLSDAEGSLLLLRLFSARYFPSPPPQPVARRWSSREKSQQKSAFKCCFSPVEGGAPQDLTELCGTRNEV